MVSDNKRPDLSLGAQSALDDRANLASLETHRHPSDSKAEASSPSALTHSPDELASSIQASVSEIAVIWMLHRWSLTQKMQDKPLHQQIRDFSPAAFNVIISRFPALKNAKQEHLWLIYFKGLLTAGTHPRDEMTKAIQTVGAQEWIRVSPSVPDASTVTPADIGPARQPPRKDLSDADALEQISRALGQPEPQNN